MKCRKADIRKYGEQDMPYEVWAYEANDKAMITSLMEKLHNDPEIDVVLMDSPGSLKTEGLIPLFVNSDIIIVPFHYDLVTVPSFRLGMMKSLAFILSPTAFFSRSTNMRKLAVDGTVTRS